MKHASRPLFESRLAWGIYFAPMVLVGGAVAMLAAWLILTLVGGDRPELDVLGLLIGVAAVISLVLAGIWLWGARRGRLSITEDELTLIPHLGRAQSVFLSRLVTVDVRRLPGSAARAMFLTDADGRSLWIGIGAWEREAEILGLIAKAADKSGAAVTPDAQEAMRRST